MRFATNFLEYSLAILPPRPTFRFFSRIFNIWSHLSLAPDALFFNFLLKTSMSGVPQEFPFRLSH